jgi:DNA-binding transcriptional ArsR family regulator
VTTLQPPSSHSIPHAISVGKLHLTIDKLAMLLGSPQRWRMLVALGNIEWLPASYLAGVAKVSRTGVSQHLRVLRENYIVEQGFGRLYRLCAPWRTRLAEGWIEFHLARVCVRFSPPEPPTPPPAQPVPAPGG